MKKREKLASIIDLARARQNALRLFGLGKLLHSAPPKRELMINCLETASCFGAHLAQKKVEQCLTTIKFKICKRTDTVRNSIYFKNIISLKFCVNMQGSYGILD